jgi:homoserine O-acetyltransferase
MLTYRSHTSFEIRFDRKPAIQKKRFAIEKESSEYKSEGSQKKQIGLQTPPGSDDETSVKELSGECARSRKRVRKEDEALQIVPVTFAAQSYLQYQAEKFLQRFDANCYLHLLNKMDSHDVTRGRMSEFPMAGEGHISNSDLKHVFRDVPPRALVISVDTDVLFRPEQQRKLAECLPEASIVDLDSSDGHDGFLLECVALGNLITDHLKLELPWLYASELGSSG